MTGFGTLKALCHKSKALCHKSEALCRKARHRGSRPGVLWHIKIRYLPNAVSQSLRIQLALNSLIRTPISNKEGTAYGGPGVLWHIKIRYVPKAPSQSLRIQLTLNSVIRMPISLAEKHSKAKTGKLSKNSALQNS